MYKVEFSSSTLLWLVFTEVHGTLVTALVTCWCQFLPKLPTKLIVVSSKLL